MVHGTFHNLFKLISGVATVIFICLALLVWRLSIGPISVDFLAPYVADSISVDDEIIFDIRGAILSWDRIAQSPQVRVIDITAVDKNANVIGVLPEMTVSLSLVSLLEGSPAPEDITLINPILRVTRKLDGTIFLGLDSYNRDREIDVGGLGVGLEQSESADLLVQLLVGILARPGDPENLPGYLDSVEIRNASIVLADRRTGLEWIVLSGGIELLRDGEGVRLRAELPYRNAGESSEILLSGIYSTQESALSLAFVFDEVKSSSFVELIPKIPSVEDINLNISGTLNLQVVFSEETAAIEQVKLEIDYGEGVIGLSHPMKRKYLLGNMKLYATASSGFDKINVEELSLSLTGDNGVDTAARLKVHGTQMRSKPNISAQLELDDLSWADIQINWPAEAAPNLRKWVQDNLVTGHITNASFDLLLGGESSSELGLTDLKGYAEFDEFEVVYNKEMPSIDNLSGKLSIGQAEVSIDISNGNIASRETNKLLDLTSGRVRLHGLNTGSPMVDLDLIINGGLREAISLIDGQPLNYASFLGLSSLSTSGEVEVLLGLDFPIIQKLSLEQFEMNTQAKIQNATINSIAFGLPLESGQFSLALDNSGMDVVGTASIGGIQTGLSWRENFLGGQYRRQYAFDAVVENNQRPLLGLGGEYFQPPYLDGPIRMEAIYTLNRDGNANLALEVDLNRPSLSLSQLNWFKPEGVEALFAADMKITAEGIESIDNFSISSVEAGLNVLGSATFTGKSKLSRLSFDQALIGKNDFTALMERKSDGTMEINALGNTIDGSTLWASIRESDQSRANPLPTEKNDSSTFRFNGRMKTLILSSGGEMTDVTLNLDQSRIGLSRISFNGFVKNGEQFQLTLTPVDNVRSFEAKSKNGGAVLEVLGLGDDFVNGDLLLTGTILESGAVDGIFKMKSFQVVDAPLLARLLSVASLTGIVDELNGDGISFSELNLPFNYFENIFTIKNGAMYGTSLGLTARGSYFMDQNIIKGEGTLIPAYAFNSAIGSIPIVGPILTGGEKSGGVFAATYSIQGNPYGGEVIVNPLATFAPGFLRQIFKVFDPFVAKPRDRVAIDSATKNE
ncbi:MAG: DUF3971 domain-containing protein [Rhodospirillaceae bacterium]